MSADRPCRSLRATPFRAVSHLSGAHALPSIDRHQKIRTTSHNSSNDAPNTRSDSNSPVFFRLQPLHFCRTFSHEADSLIGARAIPDPWRIFPCSVCGLSRREKPGFAGDLGVFRCAVAAFCAAFPCKIPCKQGIDRQAPGGGFRLGWLWRIWEKPAPAARRCGGWVDRGLFEEIWRRLAGLCG